MISIRVEQSIEQLSQKLKMHAMVFHSFRELHTHTLHTDKHPFYAKFFGDSWPYDFPKIWDKI